MNIMFFLKQKSDVVFVYDDDTIEEALIKMSPSRYSAVPVITKEDKYYGTITEGDILWALKNDFCSDWDKLNSSLVRDIKRLRDNTPIYSDEKMQNLLSRSIGENFVPVLDKKDRFIGIITRKEIIEYFFEHNFIVL